MPQIIQRKKYLRVLCILWGLLLAVLAMQPEHLVETFLPFSIMRDIAHAVTYGIMAFFLCMLFRFQRVTFIHSAIFALVLTVGWGAFTEWLQYFVPTRCVSLKDVGYDMIGAVLGLIIFGLREFNYAGQKLPKVRG